MLTINVPAQEFYDEKLNKFFNIHAHTLTLEHSLVSISKWESKWKKPFLSKDPMTNEQVIDYIKCMTISKNVDENLYNFLPEKTIKEIFDYVEDPMTATWFNDKKRPGGGRQIVTSEVIYYYMIALNVPMECQKWHLNRLITLIHVCELKQQNPKKMSKGAAMQQHKALNAARRARRGH